jgi:nucleotide-binding universal stress UspA family protein
MATAEQPRILVGVSGSRASLRALRWAAREASRREARLEVILAWQPQQPAYYAFQVGHANYGQQQVAADRKLADILRNVANAELPESLAADVVEGLAGRVLAERSVGAVMLVLGSTSSPTPSGRSIGPVIRCCLSRAACPVVVVGPGQVAGDDGAPTDDGRRAYLGDLRRARPGRLQPRRGTPVPAGRLRP